MPRESINDLSTRHQEYLDEYNRVKSLGLSLDLTRGKPSANQLDISNKLLSLPGERYLADDGTDTRNYGGLDGLPGMKALFAEILGVTPENIIVGGNSSLTMMYDYLARACQFGVVDGNGPWNRVSDRKFICPTPGYDRHFLITEHLGFKLISVDTNDNGPDMDQVESLVNADDTIKGIWCVPKYSNPTGICYSSETVKRLSGMNTAAVDFRIIWDNAYAEHHFRGDHTALENIAQNCGLSGNLNRVIQFASTSKISHPGAGVAAMAASPENISDAKIHIGVQSIGPDKVNQLRQLGLFNNLVELRSHMKKHAALVKPRFDTVIEILERELGELGIAQWTNPDGGYFISLDIPDGKAKRVVQLAADAGVKLTAAGAPFPYGKDPKDRNIRIAPTFPPLDDVRQATEVLTACVKLVVSE